MAASTEPLSKDVQDAVLSAMLNNPEHAAKIAALSDDELRKIDASVPQGSDGE